MKNADRQNRFAQPFVPDAPIIFNLPLGGKILLGRVILTGQVVLATTTAGTVFGEGGPIRLLKRIKMRVNPAPGANGPRYPGGTIVDCYPGTLLKYAATQRNGLVVGEQSGSTLGSGASGTYQIYLSIPIYFADTVLRRQVQTALNADPVNAYQSIQVEVDTADITNCFTGWTGTATYTGLSVQWVDDRENFAGDTYTLFQEDHDLIIQAAAQRQLDAAMPQDGAFLSVMYLTVTTAQQNQADTILQQVTLNGDAIDYQEYAQDIRQQMIDDGWFNPSVTPTGIYFLDFTDGLIGGSINASTLQARYQIANPGGAGLDTVRVATRRLFSPVGYTAAGGPAAAQNS
jgi:hypothetical protein